MIRVSVESDGPERARTLLEECVSGGGVAIFPADGLYGLCCDPESADVIHRIHTLKGRAEGKSSAVLWFSAPPMVQLLDLSPALSRAMHALLPGPLTVIVPNPSGHFPLACREDPSRLGVRLLGGPLEGMPLPLFQTSANRSGEQPTGVFQDLDEGLLQGVDLAIDAAGLTGEPSTVVDLTEFESSGDWTILREGAVGPDRLAELLG